MLKAGRTRLLMLVCTLALAANSAQAELISFKVTGTVTSVRGFNSLVQVGDTLTYCYTFESTTPDTASRNTLGRYPGAVVAATVEAGSLSLNETASLTSNITVSDFDPSVRRGLDRYLVYANRLEGSGFADVAARLTMIDPSNQPYIGERFIGTRDASVLEHQGETRCLETSKVTTFKHAMLATTDPYLFNSDEKAVFDMIRRRCKLHRFGFDAYGYAMLAGGGLDLVIESGLQSYDVQALIPIIEGAGGYITNWSGGSAAQGGQVVATGSEALHEQALNFLKHVATD